jgi:hypothetical protein
MERTVVLCTLDARTKATAATGRVIDQSMRMTTGMVSTSSMWFPGTGILAQSIIFLEDLHRITI